MNEIPDCLSREKTRQLSIADLLYYATLLSRSDASAPAATSEQMALLNTSAQGGRTCIDGGSPLLFSLVAPAKRALRLLVRQPATEDGVLPWLRTYYDTDQPVERWHSETFVGEPASAWRKAVAAAERVGAVDCFSHIHRLLGAHSRLYTVSHQLSAENLSVCVGWQLDRTFPVDEALAAIGYAHVWPTAQAVWDKLLGFAPHPRRGPWSIGLELAGASQSMSLSNERPALRLGSTNWARQGEDIGKRTRLAKLLEEYQGDRAFAEAIYKLLGSTIHHDRPHAIGRAVEILVEGDQMKEIEFYLGLP